MQILHNPRCAKSRDTLKIIKDHGIDPEVILYLKETPTIEQLRLILSKLGLDVQSILRKGEAVYKEKFKGRSFSEDEWLKILVENPKLIERPIVIKDDKAIIGRPPEVVMQLF